MTNPVNFASEALKGGEMEKRAAEADWALSGLGAPSDWPSHFRTALNQCLRSPVPSLLWWGPGFTELYNDAFKLLWGASCIDSFGKPGGSGNEAVWKVCQPFLMKVTDRKETFLCENTPLVTNPSDPSGQHYFTFAFHPVFAPSGAVEGVLATMHETTSQVMANAKLYTAEQRLRLAIEAAAVGTFDWDMQTNDFIYSERLAQIFGYQGRGNLLHEDFSDAIHPADIPARTKAHEEAIRTGILFYDVRLIWPDGSEHWIRTNGKILYKENGEPGRMYGIVLDITGQKEQEAQLEKKVAERTRQLLIQNDEIIHQKQLMDSIIDASVDYICAIDLNEDLLLFNKKYEEASGYKKEIAVGKSIIAIFPSLLGASKNILENFRKALKGEALHTEKQYSPADGKYFENFFIPLKSFAGEVFGAMLLSHDITYRIHAEEKLIKTNEEIIQSNQRLEQFAYVASHDLQEPLRKIQTFAELMHRNIEKKEESEKYYHKIVGAAQRMSALIKDVLAYSKLSDTDIRLKEIDLNQIVENVRIDFELLIAEKKAKIIHDPLPVIKGIPLQMNQLFSNLIGNSLKFSRREPLIRITSSDVPYDEQKAHPELDMERRYVKLVFTDNGIGFDQQYAQQIFTIFQRLNDRQSYSGTGIGLALCKKIVENHHGLITASSVPGKGAEFMIYLPLN